MWGLGALDSQLHLLILHCDDHLSWVNIISEDIRKYNRKKYV
jgi:hypothetical protein